MIIIEDISGAQSRQKKKKKKSLRIKGVVVEGGNIQSKGTYAPHLYIYSINQTMQTL